MSKSTDKKSFFGYKIKAGLVTLNNAQLSAIETAYSREGELLAKYAQDVEQQPLDEFINEYVNQVLIDGGVTDVKVTSYQVGASKDAILSETMKTIKADALHSFSLNTKNEDVVTYGKNKYIKDAKGNWKALSITFTVRSDKQNGLDTPEAMQKHLDKLAKEQNKEPSEEEIKNADVVEPATEDVKEDVLN